MHVTIVTIGSRGDVQPYVALGRGFRRAGHQVRLVTHGEFQELAAPYGLEFGVVKANPKAVLESEAGLDWVDSGHNTLKFLQSQLRLGESLMREMSTDIWHACRDRPTDVILFSMFGLPGHSVARKLGVPCMAAWLQPIGRSAHYPSLIVPPTWDFGPFSNRLTHALLEAAMWLPFMPAFNRWRRQILGLSNLPLSGPRAVFRRERLPMLFGISPTIFPKPPDWPPHLHVPGYWFLNRSDSWQPPADLLDFLAAGPPPVYIGFGSMRTRNPAEMVNLALGALAKAGQRGILLTGWGGLSPDAVPDDLFVIDSVPHDWLFPRMAAVVHHGGAGTSAAGFRAGIPSIIIPFFADQPFWAHRAQELGISPGWMMRQKVTVAWLAQAIRQAVTDRELQRRAAEVGRKIRAETGIETAVRQVEAFISA